MKTHDIRGLGSVEFSRMRMDRHTDIDLRHLAQRRSSFLILRIEQDDWQIEWTSVGISSIRLRGAEILASTARPIDAAAAPWHLDAHGDRGIWIQPASFELTRSMVWPFYYEREMEVVVRGTNLMPLTRELTRTLEADYTVRLEWPSSRVAISIGWDPDRLAPASLTLKTEPPCLELALGAVSGRNVRPESWWVMLRDGAGGRPIEVVDYDTAWPMQFETEKAHIVQALGELLAVLEHAGSTAVPGLAAKPIIDMWAALRQPPGPVQIQAMAGIGYKHFGEYGLAGRDYFVKSSPPQCHLHCYPEGHPDWNRHLAFRDWLRAHPEGARSYAALKRELAHRFSGDLMAYTEAKSNFIESAIGRGNGP